MCTELWLLHVQPHESQSPVLSWPTIALPMHPCNSEPQHCTHSPSLNIPSPWGVPLSSPANTSAFNFQLHFQSIASWSPAQMSGDGSALAPTCVLPLIRMTLPSEALLCNPHTRERGGSVGEKNSKGQLWTTKRAEIRQQRKQEFSRICWCRIQGISGNMQCSLGGATNRDVWELGQSESIGDAGMEERLILLGSEELYFLLGVRNLG